MAKAIAMSINGFFGQMIVASWHSNSMRCLVQYELQIGIIKRGYVLKLILGQRPKHALVSIYIVTGFIKVDFESVMNFRIEILKQLPPSVLHRFINKLRHFLLKGLECSLDLVG